MKDVERGLLELPDVCGGSRRVVEEDVVVPEVWHTQDKGTRQIQTTQRTNPRGA
jgi:hypothetical protein